MLVDGHSGMRNPNEIDDLPIGVGGIRLGWFLRFTGFLDSRGLVKEVIGEARVTVDGEVDRRRGRPFGVSDIVGFPGRQAPVRS
jgi:ribosome-associated protein